MFTLSGIRNHSTLFIIERRVTILIVSRGSERQKVITSRLSHRSQAFPGIQVGVALALSKRAIFAKLIRLVLHHDTAIVPLDALPYSRAL